MSQSQAWTHNIDFGRIKTAGREGAKIGLAVALDHVLGVSNDRVPVERGMSGGLESTGAATIDDGDRIRGAISYDKEYAVRQHEDLSYRHDEGRQAKYLESAFADESSKIGEFIAEGIRRSLGT